MNERVENCLSAWGWYGGHNNTLYTDRYLGKCGIVHVDQDAEWTLANKPALPEIMHVDTIVPGKVVKVTFTDFTTEKAVCQEPDVFSLEQAFTICLCKKLMGGSGAFNKAIKHAVKVYKEQLRKEEEDKKETLRIEKRRAKRKAYLARRAEKRANAEKERQIEIQKEAYIRAMQCMNESKGSGAA